MATEATHIRQKTREEEVAAERAYILKHYPELEPFAEYFAERTVAVCELKGYAHLQAAATLNAQFSRRLREAAGAR